MKDNFKTFKPAGKMQFEFTDLISGYVSNFSEQKKTFTLTTSDGRAFEVALTDTTFARLMRNLDEPYQDATGNMYSLLAQDGRMVFSILSQTVSTLLRQNRLIFPKRLRASFVLRSKTGGLIRQKVFVTSLSAHSSPTATSITTTTAPL